MRSSENPIKPYGSANDLPTVKKMREQIAALRLLGAFLPPTERQTLKQLEKQQREISRTVDDFYSLLGDRNWVFHGELNLPAIREVIATDDAEEAERRLVKYYQEDGRISFSVRRFHRFEAMRPRRQLLLNALRDYEEGRYYSTVFVLLAVMDGFVNEFETSTRKGLHTRSVEDMVAWDSVAGHHKGLSRAHASFIKGFYKTSNEEVHDLYRNGIMHGVLLNFDNVVVASKAWNRLFAVTDWADSRINRAKPVEPEPSLRESLVRYQEIQVRKSRLDEWQPHEHEIGAVDLESDDLVATCIDFLGRWQNKQYGPLGQHFITFGAEKPSVGQQAVLAKDLFWAHDLTAWVLLRRKHSAAAVALVDVELTIGKVRQPASLRWVRIGENGHSATEWEQGAWKLSPYGPSTFLE